MENRVKNTSLEIYNPVGEREKHTQIKEVEKEGAEYRSNWTHSFTLEH